jgi:hypothetical protein
MIGAIAMDIDSRKYSGTLDYLDEPGQLIINELFVRKDSISLSGSSCTPEYGIWPFTAQLPLVQGKYQQGRLHAYRDDVTSDPFKLEIAINPVEDGRLEVEGNWIEGDDSRFKGTLIAAQLNDLK